MKNKTITIANNISDLATSEEGVVLNPLLLKDRWYAEEDLGIQTSLNLKQKSLLFNKIKQPWVKAIAKQYILSRRNQGLKFATLKGSLQVIRDFAGFLEAEYIDSFDDIDDEILSKFLGSINNRITTNGRQSYISTLKSFLDLGTINGWFNVSTYILKKNAPRRVKPSQIEYIPNEVLKQLDEHLHLLPESVQRMVILIRTLGLRSCELLGLKFDCLRQRQNQNWEIEFVNWKFKERLDRLPINEILANVIKQQQLYIKEQLGEDFEFLFCGSKSSSGSKPDDIFRFFPKPQVMSTPSFNRYLNKLAKHCNICDNSGQLWKFKSHQFRRTVATKMTNEGVRQYVIQMYLRHCHPDMMLHYAYLLPETMKKEMAEFRKHKKIIDITGTSVKSIYPELDNDIGLQWLRSKMQPKALAMGFCARPALLKPCPHANACMSCQHFRLDTDDLPALKQHLERSQKLKSESKRLGYIRQIKGIEEEELKLINLIKTLEDDNESNNLS